MQPISDNNLSLQLLIIYGLIVVIYLVLLRFLTYVFQRMWDAGGYHKSVIDRDIHRTMTRSTELSFNPYSLPRVLVRAIVVVSAMAAVILIVYLRFGLFLTALIITASVLILWILRYWSKNSRKTQSLREEARKYVTNLSGAGLLIGLCMSLGLLLLMMVGLK